MLQRFTRGAVACPVLLELIELLDSLEYHYERAERAEEQMHIDLDAGKDGDRGGQNYLGQLDHLVHPLVGATAAVVPVDLVVQPDHGRISFAHHLASASGSRSRPYRRGFPIGFVSEHVQRISSADQCVSLCPCSCDILTERASWSAVTASGPGRSVSILRERRGPL